MPPEEAPGSTSEVARIAVGRVGASLGRRARLASARVRAAALRAAAAAQRVWTTRPKVVLAVAALVAVSAGVIGIPSSRGSSRRTADPVSALALARAANRENGAALQHAASAVEMKEFGEALEVLERARTASPSLGRDPLFVSLSLQTFNAGRSSRSAALLALTPQDEAIAALQAASLDWSWRVRHGAADLLKSIGVALEDPVGAGLLDVWQLERCDQRRATASRLLAAPGRDERLVAGLTAASRRAADEGCLRDLLPAASAAR